MWRRFCRRKIFCQRELTGSQWGAATSSFFEEWESNKEGVTTSIISFATWRNVDIYVPPGRFPCKTWIQQSRPRDVPSSPQKLEQLLVGESHDEHEPSPETNLPQSLPVVVWSIGLFYGP